MTDTTMPSIRFPEDHDERMVVAEFLRQAHRDADGAHIEMPNGEMIYTGSWDTLADLMELMNHA